MSVDVEDEVKDQANKQTDQREVDLEPDHINPLHMLQQEIANLPEVDQAKVQAVIKKLESGNLSILGTAEERLESAKRIAEQIMNEIAESDQ